MKLILLLCLSFLPHTVLAHNSSYSYSNWEVKADTEEATVTAQMKFNLRDWSILKEGAYLPSLSLGETKCTSSQASSIKSIDGDWLTLSAMYSCPLSMGIREGMSFDNLTIGFSSIFDAIPQHIHSIKHLDKTSFLTPYQNEVKFNINSATNPREISWFKTGFRHIFDGLDHLLFLILLVLLCSKWKKLSINITAFTLGHLLSSILVTQKLVNINSNLSEALIALSIFILAFQLFQKNSSSPARLKFTTSAYLFLFLGFLIFTGDPFTLSALGFLIYFLFSGFLESKNNWIVITLFGLIHGTGFGGFVLMTSQNTSSFVDLIKFNLGVELGQVCFVITVTTFLALMPKLKIKLNLIESGCALASTALSIAWALESIF